MTPKQKLRKAFMEGMRIGAARRSEPDYYVYTTPEELFQEFLKTIAPTPDLNVWSVPVTESEAGWGRKIDDYMICLTKEDALTFTKEFNARNTATSTPAFYMQVEHEPEPITITLEQHEYLMQSEKKRVWQSSLKHIKHE